MHSYLHPYTASMLLLPCLTTSMGERCLGARCCAALRRGARLTMGSAFVTKHGTVASTLSWFGNKVSSTHDSCVQIWQFCLKAASRRLSVCGTHLHAKNMGAMQADAKHMGGLQLFLWPFRLGSAPEALWVDSELPMAARALVPWTAESRCRVWQLNCAQAAS